MTTAEGAAAQEAIEYVARRFVEFFGQGHGAGVPPAVSTPPGGGWQAQVPPSGKCECVPPLPPPTHEPLIPDAQAVIAWGELVDAPRPVDPKRDPVFVSFDFPVLPPNEEARLVIHEGRTGRQLGEIPVHLANTAKIGPAEWRFTLGVSVPEAQEAGLSLEHPLTELQLVDQQGQPITGRIACTINDPAKAVPAAQLYQVTENHGIELADIHTALFVPATPDANAVAKRLAGLVQIQPPRNPAEAGRFVTLSLPPGALDPLAAVELRLSPLSINDLSHLYFNAVPPLQPNDDGSLSVQVPVASLRQLQVVPRGATAATTGAMRGAVGVGVLTRSRFIPWPGSAGAQSFDASLELPGSPVAALRSEHRAYSPEAFGEYVRGFSALVRLERKPDGGVQVVGAPGAVPELAGVSVTLRLAGERTGTEVPIEVQADGSFKTELLGVLGNAELSFHLFPMFANTQGSRADQQVGWGSVVRGRVDAQGALEVDYIGNLTR